MRYECGRVKEVENNHDPLVWFSSSSSDEVISVPSYRSEDSFQGSISNHEIQPGTSGCAEEVPHHVWNTRGAQKPSTSYHGRRVCCTSGKYINNDSSEGTQTVSWMNTIFQQDIALWLFWRCHGSSSCSISWKKAFQEMLIRWPHRSPGFTELEFLFWGLCKELHLYGQNLSPEIIWKQE